MQSNSISSDVPLLAAKASLAFLAGPSVVVVIALVLCLFASRLATPLGLIDRPGGRKKHKTPTPLMGGIAILVSLLPIMAIWGVIGRTTSHGVTLTLAAATAAMSLLGLVDDRRHVRATVRLAASAAIILAAIAWQPLLVIQAISWNGHRSIGMATGVLAIPATTFAVVAFINAVNMADGKNGLVISLSICWILLLIFFAPNSLLAPLIMTVAMLLVLLAFNLSGRLFLGDGGTYGLGTFVGLCSIYVYRNSPVSVTADQIALLFLLPVADMARLMVVRLYKRQSPFVGDRDHLHHHLLSYFGWPGGLLVYLIMVTMPILLAIALPRLTLAIIFIAIAAYFGAIFGLSIQPKPAKTDSL